MALCGAVLLISACKKEVPSSPSQWTIKGESFESNKVYKDQGKAIAMLQTYNSENGFIIIMRSGRSAPAEAQIKCDTTNPMFWCMRMYYNGIAYINPRNASLKVGMLNGHRSYFLPPAWFYNASNPADSTEVSGYFNEP